MATDLKERTVDGIRVDYLDALRKAAGLQIPETAEVCWRYAQMEDPYGDGIHIPEECDQVGREYFARIPGTNVWILFRDLPDATADALFEKHKAKLMFPAGLDEAAELHARRAECEAQTPTQ